MNIPDYSIAMSPQIHTYAEFRQQIHGDLRIQHPEWVEPDGESSMRLLELLDTLTRKGSDKSSLLSAETGGAGLQMESAAVIRVQAQPA